MLSAMNISFIWATLAHSWLWIPKPESRFERIGMLSLTRYLEIRTRVNSNTLSPRTHYSAYIVFKKMSKCYGFKDVKIEAEVGVVGQESSKRFICFDPCTNVGRRKRRRIEVVKPVEREDGWMEIELGVFFNELNTDEIEMSVSETTLLNRKHGLILGGIEIRPTKIV